MSQAGNTFWVGLSGISSNATPGDRSNSARLTILVLVLLYVGVAGISLNVGAAQISLTNAAAHIFQTGLFAESSTNRDRIILLDIRLPRLILGSLIGAALAVSGAVLQSLFRNPLADPGLIGISAGASFGAVLVIVLGGTSLSFVTSAFGLFSLPVMAFIGALAVTYFLYRISTSNGQTSIVTMLLAGIALQAFAFALTGILIFLADDQQLRDLTFWSLGSLAGATWAKIVSSGSIILASFVVLPFLAIGLNAISLGEATAFHLGVPVQKLKTIAITLAAAATGAAVAVSGGIGFVGIVVPHLLRLLIGPDNRYLLPASALLGACLLTFADMIARTIVAPAELPIGIITALAGAPFFIWLLVRKRGVLET
ncbi:MAG: iron ABC transporter permease [Pseudomonadota bacterium]